MKNNRNYGSAPYNFVPLPETIVHRYSSSEALPTHDASRSEDKELLSGEITFNIVAEQPILVAEGTNEKNVRTFVKNATGAYEIPGSTLRGLMRNTISVLSLSDWTEQIDDERFFYRAMADSKSMLGKHYESVLNVKNERVNNKRESIPLNVKAGYIAKMNDGNYCIYHAKTDGGRHGRTYYKVNDGNLTIRKKQFKEKVEQGFFVEAATFSINEHGNVVKMFHTDARYKGHLLYSGFIKTGKTKKVSAYLINEIDLERTPIDVSLTDVKYYNVDLKHRLSKFPNRNRKRMERFFELPKEAGVEHAKPCFYLHYDGITYFGFTAFLRLLFPNSTKDLLPDYIKDNKRGIDYTSALFGFTNASIEKNEGKQRRNYASRIQFHSANIKTNVKPLEPIPMILGTPRASAYRFYLNQDEIEQPNDIHSYLTKDTTIRGMKQYWLKEAERPNVAGQNQNTLNHLQFLPKHTTFQAKITFDQLHEDELGLLLWALKRPSFHQIGSGKPYGYGVVTFELIKCFVTNNKKMYQDLTNLFDIGEEQVAIDDYINTYKTHMKHLLKKQRYPIDESFDLEQIKSIKIFLAMKEKAVLNKEDMQYTELRQYSKVTLPTANQLLNMEAIPVHKDTQKQFAAKEKERPKHPHKQKRSNHNRKQQGEQRKRGRNEYDGRTLTHNPLADMLKDFKPKNK